MFVRVINSIFSSPAVLRARYFQAHAICGKEGQLIINIDLLYITALTPLLWLPDVASEHSTLVLKTGFVQVTCAFFICTKPLIVLRPGARACHVLNE